MEFTSQRSSFTLRPNSQRSQLWSSYDAAGRPNPSWLPVVCDREWAEGLCNRVVLAWSSAKTLSVIDTDHIASSPTIGARLNFKVEPADPDLTLPAFQTKENEPNSTSRKHMLLEYYLRTGPQKTVLPRSTQPKGGSVRRADRPGSDRYIYSYIRVAGPRNEHALRKFKSRQGRGIVFSILLKAIQPNPVQDATILNV